MSYAAYKMMHWPTTIDTCVSGFVTHSRSESAHLPQLPTDDLDSDWPSRRRRGGGIGPTPNLIVASGNVLELYVVRVQEEGARSSGELKRGGVMDGVAGVSLELVCHLQVTCNVESMGVLSVEGGDDSRRRDSILLAFKDAKISVLEFDDSIHGLRNEVNSMHCFEGPDWRHLKRGRRSFARGPLVKVDPQGRCGGVLVYDLQMIILKAAQSLNFVVSFFCFVNWVVVLCACIYEAGSALVQDEDAFGSGAAISAHIASSYIINLRDLDMKHVKDFIFVHDYIDPVVVVLHERELTWAGRVVWKHHTCMISALSISTTLKQPTLIWSIGSASFALALNSYAASVDSSQELPRATFCVELDAANATWLSKDVALLSTKTGEILLLTLVYDGRVVQRLDLSKSKASVLTSDITTLGNSFFFLGSRLGDSLLVQFTSGLGSSMLSPGLKEVYCVGLEILKVILPSAKRLKVSSSDALQDMVSGEELSLYSSAPNNAESSQKTFSFTVRDSLTNVGPLKDFAYGLRINADANETGISKQSNYELVCCSGHGKNGALCVLQQSIRPEMITEVELPGCKGIWTVYHKNARSHSVDSLKMASDDEYHAYLIISMEARTMVLETADHLTEVTESVGLFCARKNNCCRELVWKMTIFSFHSISEIRRVVQVFERGARILDGSFMTQDLSFGGSNSETGRSESSTVMHVSIVDPYVLVRMADGSIQILVGDPSACTVSVNTPSAFQSSTKSVSACTLYHDKGPEPWLRKTSTDAWLSTGISEAIDGADSGAHEQGDIYCVVCYETGALEIFDVPNFNSVFFVDKFVSGKTHRLDTCTGEPAKDLMKGVNEEVASAGRKESTQNMKVVELAMLRWSGRHSRPFLFGILTDGTILCYHAHLFEGPDGTSKLEDSVSAQNSVGASSISASRLRNLRFVRVPLDTYTREETSSETSCQRITTFKNISGYQGFFLSGSRPAWFMVFRERLRVHPQLCDGSIVAFTVLHTVNCNHGLIYVTSQGNLKICHLSSASSYDNYWPVQKIPLKGTPHQVTYFAERNLYPLIVSVPVQKPVNQVLSSLVDQEVGHQIENHNLSSDEIHRTYSVDEFEVRILEPSNGPWQVKATIPMQTSGKCIDCTNGFTVCK
ncbi:cleavage and polyadenylation specificity factor subunit 1 [Populus alba x Populus x berolinensis]|nr:cleavage and polyadenylation specificity factor subunit 1 [Populus alba x Populus x berolinensis]